MKKNVCALIVIMLVSLCGCTDNQVADNKKVVAPVSKAAVQMEKVDDQEVPLYRTKDNINNVDMKQYEECPALNDRAVYETLDAVEHRSSNIVKAKVLSCEGQIVQTEHNYSFDYEEAMCGTTQWKIEIQQAYKGKMKKGEMVIINQEYFVWTSPDGSKQLIKMGDQPMLKVGDEILVMLGDEASKQVGGYVTWCNENSLFTTPSKDVIEHIDTVKLTEENMNIKRNDQNYDWSTHQKIYRDVVKKYYK